MLQAGQRRLGRILARLVVAALIALPPSASAAPAVARIGCQPDMDARVAALTNAIAAANAGAGPDTIELDAGCPYTLTSIDNVTPDGPNGLPDIVATVVIRGNGAIIERGSDVSTPHFRLLHVGWEGSLTLDRLILRGGRAPDAIDAGTHGGGVYNWGGRLTLINSTVTGNSAGSGGVSGGGGGGLFNVGTLTLITSTISGNAAGHGGLYGGHGGGLYNAGLLSVFSSTISSNSAGGGSMEEGSGGGLFNSFGTASIVNSIVAGNRLLTSDTARSSDCGHFLPAMSGGHNLLGGRSDVVSSDCPFSDELSDKHVSPVFGIPAVLTPLGYYGGLMLSHGLQAGPNPAVDAGDDATCADPATGDSLDQRGFRRTVGSACDIGAVERDASPDELLADET